MKTKNFVLGFATVAFLLVGTSVNAQSASKATFKAPVSKKAPTSLEKTNFKPISEKNKISPEAIARLRKNAEARKPKATTK